MKKKFTFIDYADLISECMNNGVGKSDDQASYVKDKILQCPLGSIGVLDFIGSEHMPIDGEHLERILFSTLSEYKDKHGENLPLVITNLTNERLLNLEDQGRLLTYIRENKCLIPVLNEYGELFAILGTNEGIDEALKSCLLRNGNTAIQSNMISSRAMERLILMNSWLLRKNDTFYTASFSIPELLNYIAVYIIRERLDAIQKGHFELLSGKHTLEYISSAALITKPQFTAWMARILYSYFKRMPIDCIVTYSAHTYILAFTLKEEFKRKGTHVSLLLMDNYDNPYIKESSELVNKRVLVVTDVTGTGQLLERMARAIKSEGGKIQGLTAVIEANLYDRYRKDLFYAPCQHYIALYDPYDKYNPCPACQEPNKNPLYYLSPITNLPSPIIASREAFTGITSGNEENKGFWEMVKKTDALKTHILFGKKRKHYYYYIDTYVILENYIDKIKWDIQSLYRDEALPDIILFPNNPSALKIADYLIKNELPATASLMPVDKSYSTYTIYGEHRVKGKSILIIDHVTYTGQTIGALLNLCKRINGDLDKVKICIFVDRLIGAYRETLLRQVSSENIKSIYKLPIPVFKDDPENCPLCAEVILLKKHYNLMSLEAQKYIDQRLEKIKEKEIVQDFIISAAHRKEAPESTISRGKVLDFLSSKGDTAFLEALRNKTPLEELFSILEAIPHEYLRMTGIKEWLSNQVSKITDIGHLTKFIRMWLNIDPGVILKHSDHIVKQFARSKRNLFLTYVLEYLVYEQVVSKDSIRGYLETALKRLGKYAGFINGVRKSVIFKYPEKILLRQGLMDMYDNTICRVAPTDANVLITGESGAGKEVIAKIIHDISPRRKNPFQDINISSLSESLIESELFGHERGAFTGSIERKKGTFELSDKGTAFLDEVSEIPVPLQVKLLKVLDKKEFYRVGGTKPVKPDFRLICATNKPLGQLVASGMFRYDLFQRISTICIDIPPLRQNPNDIITLSEYYFDFFSKRHKKKPIYFNNKIKAILRAHVWPGNVRELENIIEEAVIFSDNGKVDIDRIRGRVENSSNEVILDTKPFKEIGNELKRKRLINALEKNRWNKSQTAKDLQISRPWLYRIMRKYHIKPNTFSSEI